jgi:2'-5' RNA ligase
MRLFVAVDLSEKIRENLNDVLAAISRFRGVKPVEKQNLHITLQFIGEVNERKAEDIKRALSEIKFSSFTLKFKGIGFFPNQRNPRVIWVGTGEGESKMKALASEVETALKKLGFRKDKEFVAHATVGRIKRMSSEDRRRLVSELSRYFNAEFGEMVVSDFRLKKSTLTPKGPIYEDVEIFRLE